MTRDELLAAIAHAGLTAVSRDHVADEIDLMIEVHRVFSDAVPKPADALKKIRDGAKALHELLESMPDAWRFSLGTPVSETGEWEKSLDWRPALELLAERADIMTKDQAGEAPKRGAPFDGKFYVLLGSFVELWERELPNVVPVTKHAGDSGSVETLNPFSGPLLDLVETVLKGYEVKFTSRRTLGHTLLKIIKTEVPSTKAD